MSARVIECTLYCAYALLSAHFIETFFVAIFKQCAFEEEEGEAKKVLVTPKKAKVPTSGKKKSKIICMYMRSLQQDLRPFWLRLPIYNCVFAFQVNKSVFEQLLLEKESY